MLQHILHYKESQLDTAVGYFYFDFNDVEKQSSKKAVRSLLFQIALQTSECLQDLESLYQKHENGQQQPADNVIQSLFCDKIAQIEHVYIILDALDECKNREPFLEFHHKLTDINGGFRILATSRREKDIENLLSTITDYNINIESAIVDRDIFVYVRDRLVTDLRLRKWPLAVHEEIKTILMEKAGGMYERSVRYHAYFADTGQVSMGILSTRRYSKVRQIEWPQKGLIVLTKGFRRDIRTDSS